MRSAPVSGSSSRLSSRRAILKVDGTMPLALPEWTPSVSISTVIQKDNVREIPALVSRAKAERATAARYIPPPIPDESNFVATSFEVCAEDTTQPRLVVDHQNLKHLFSKDSEAGADSQVSAGVYVRTR